MYITLRKAYDPQKLEPRITACSNKQVVIVPITIINKMIVRIIAILGSAPPRVGAITLLNTIIPESAPIQAPTKKRPNLIHIAAKSPIKAENIPQTISRT